MKQYLLSDMHITQFVILKLEPQKACGFDDIVVIVLKKCTDERDPVPSNATINTLLLLAFQHVEYSPLYPLSLRSLAKLLIPSIIALLFFYPIWQTTRGSSQQRICLASRHFIG